MKITKASLKRIGAVNVILLRFCGNIFQARAMYCGKKPCWKLRKLKEPTSIYILTAKVTNPMIRANIAMAKFESNFLCTIENFVNLHYICALNFNRRIKTKLNNLTLTLSN